MRVDSVKVTARTDQNSFPMPRVEGGQASRPSSTVADLPQQFENRKHGHLSRRRLFTPVRWVELECAECCRDSDAGDVGGAA